MSRLRKKIIQEAKANDRRFAKGTVCRLIYGEAAVQILYLYDLIPLGTILNGSAKNQNKIVPTAMSSINGVYFVIPVQDYPLFLEELALYTSTPIQADLTSLDTDIVESNLNRHEAIVKFLKQTMAMVKIPKDQCPNGQPMIDPFVYDIMIETIDLGESLTGIVVPRSNFSFRRTQPLH